jgi:hypothetical protein
MKRAQEIIVAVFDLPKHEAGYGTTLLQIRSPSFVINPALFPLRQRQRNPLPLQLLNVSR